MLVGTSPEKRGTLTRKELYLLLLSISRLHGALRTTLFGTYNLPTVIRESNTLSAFCMLISFSCAMILMEIAPYKFKFLCHKPSRATIPWAARRIAR